jgi:hypothetical protein
MYTRVSKYKNGKKKKVGLVSPIEVCTISNTELSVKRKQCSNGYVN